MYFFIAAATAKEIQPTIENLSNYQIQNREMEPAVLITGVGMIATTYSLVQAINRRPPDYILQAGIAGSLSGAYPPGSVCIISEEVLGDFGAQENGDFNDAFDLGLIENDQPPFTGKILLNPHLAEWKKTGVPFGKGISINEITTDHRRIEGLKEKYGSDIESMEGAALHYVCLREKIPFLQLRAVSNYIGERDKTKWKMNEAIVNLNEQLMKIITGLGRNK